MTDTGPCGPCGAPAGASCQNSQLLSLCWRDVTQAIEASGRNPEPSIFDLIVERMAERFEDPTR